MSIVIYRKACSMPKVV